jgi:signal transduction histidine kinase
MVWGVRARTTLLAAALVLLALAVTGVALVAAQRHTLVESVDEALERQGSVVASQLDDRSLPKVLPGQGDDDAFAQVIGASGDIVAETTTSPGRLDLALPGSNKRVFQSVHVPGAEGEYRVMSDRHAGVVIRTATPLDDVNDSVSTLVRGLSVAVPAVTLLLAGLVWVLVGRVLRPVEQIRRQVAEISGSSLDRRVPVPATRDEVSRLAQTMNLMLGRLEDSAARQQRFIADASHELRSPLARMRAELEVDMAHPSGSDHRATQQSMLDETESLQRLVDDLLMLARSDGDGSLGRREAVDLDDVVMREVRRMREAGGLTIDTSSVSAAQVAGDPTHLARVVRNLLENARQHGGPSVTISLVEREGQAVLTVSDDGAGIPDDLRERVFERFARADDARVRSGHSSGLGLAISREIVTSMGGSIVLDPAHHSGASFVVRLPLVGAD